MGCCGEDDCWEVGCGEEDDREAVDGEGEEEDGGGVEVQQQLHLFHCLFPF